MNRQPLRAALYGALCHGIFAVGVGVMAVQLYLGMHAGPVALSLPWAAAWDLGLVAQFAVLHSWLLTRQGTRLLRRAAPASVGGMLDTTLYATVAAVQVLLLFGLWAPLDDTVSTISGMQARLAQVSFVAGWILLLRAMAEAGLGVQTGATGWLALWRGGPPRYPRGFPDSGLHGLCRHPIYAAFALILWTGPHWSLDRLLLAVPLTLYCILGPRRKEARYLARYGQAYAEYAAQTPPFLPRPVIEVLHGAVRLRS